MISMDTGAASLPRRRTRSDGADPRVVRTLLAERREQRRARTGGRAWINGREVGGTDPRYAHLGLSYD